MYQGKNKTALCSQKNIADAFMRLLSQKPYTAISISALCKEASVSRQTFYSLFNSKENVISYILEDVHCYQPKEEVTCKVTLETLSHEYAEYIEERKELITILEKNNMMSFMQEIQYHSFMECNCFNKNMSEKEKRYAAGFAASGLTSIARCFVTDENDSEDYLEKMIVKLFSGHCFF